jgi:hypothetical protein
MDNFTFLRACELDNIFGSSIQQDRHLHGLQCAITAMDNTVPARLRRCPFDLTLGLDNTGKQNEKTRQNVATSHSAVSLPQINFHGFFLFACSNSDVAVSLILFIGHKMLKHLQKYTQEAMTLCWPQTPH